jgi:hypothetical protein
LAKAEDSTPKYDVTFIFLGTNDAQNFIVDNTLYPFGSTSWSEVYSDRVENLIRATCKVSDHVYWVSSLKMRSKDFDRKLKFLHSLAKEKIQSEKEATIQEIRTETAHIAISIAEKIIGQTLDNKKDEKFIQELLSKMK